MSEQNNNDIANKEKLKEGFKNASEKISSFWDKWSWMKKDLRSARKNFWKKKFLFQVFEDWAVHDYERYSKSEQDLIAELKREWITPLNIIEVKSDNYFIWLIDGLKWMWSVTLVELWAFASSMSLLTRNWVDIVSSLKETNETITNKYFKNKIQILIENISSWQKEPHQYFWEFPEIFDNTFISILKTADKSWKYWDSFKEISNQIQIQIRLNKLKKKAKTQPAINWLVFLWVTITMLVFVFPKMKDFFKNQELPQITQIFLAVSDFMTENLALIFVWMLGFWIIMKQVITNPAVRAFFDRLWLSIPIIKDWVKNSNMYIFANTFETLWYSWYDSLTSLEQLKTTITNTVYLEEINRMIENIKTWTGWSETPITDVMRRNPHLWRTTTSNAIILVSSWEKIGKIHEPLRKEKETFLIEYEESINKVIWIINSIVFVATACLVVSLIAAILFPLMSFDPSASRNAMQNS